MVFLKLCLNERRNSSIVNEFFSIRMEEKALLEESAFFVDGFIFTYDFFIFWQFDRSV